MIARVADHCFWLGRYLERVESTARVLHVNGSIALDAELSAREAWQPLVIVAGQEQDFEARLGREALGDGEAVQRYLTWDEANPVSIRASLAAARDNARSIREVISLEVWLVVNELHVHLASAEAAEQYAHHRDAFYARIRRAAQLALALLPSTMLHDAPLDFLTLGVLLERASQTARLLDVEHHAMTSRGAAHPVVQTALWLSLLRACSGFEPFMKRNQGKVTGQAVAAFLVLEPRFPRSVRHCVRWAEATLEGLRRDGSAGEAALERLHTLDGWLDALSAEDLEGEGVHRVLTRVVDSVHETCSLIGEELFGHRVGTARGEAAQ